MSNNILQYESSIWATADLLRGSGFKDINELKLVQAASDRKQFNFDDMENHVSKGWLLL